MRDIVSLCIGPHFLSHFWC